MRLILKLRVVVTVLLLLYVSNTCALDRELFERGEVLSVKCVTCHGVKGISSNPRVPHLAGQHEPYLLKQLQDFRSRRRFNSAMRQITTSMSNRELKALAYYYSKLPRQP